MPRIINTFASENPLAKAIGALGNSMFGDQLTPALKRQQLADSQREQFGIEEMARVFGGVTDGNVPIARAVESGILGGMKPDDIAAFNMLMAGTQTPLGSELTDKAYVGAGKANVSPWNLGLDRTNAFNMNEADNVQSGLNNRYSSDRTYQASTENNALDNAGLTDRFNRTPKEAMVNGQPGFVEQGTMTQTPGVTPILSENQVPPVDQFRRQLVASQLMFPDDPARARSHAIEQLSKPKSKGFSFQSPDGTTIEFGGTDGPMDLTNANQTAVQGNEIAFRKFEGTLAMAQDLVANNPNSVGLIGQARGGAQDLATMAQGAAQLFGIQDVQGDLIHAKKEAERFGINLDFEYDPSVSKIESIMNILAFQGARAIGGQSGNDLSDKDLKAIKVILGDPTSLFTNQTKLLSRLELVRNYVADQRKINLQIMGAAPPAAPGTTPPAAAAPAAPAAPAAAAPPAAPPVTEDQKVIGGKTFVKQNGQWFEVTQ